ncbi:hypothetical protein [Cesiribacter andamanensis]|uniref:Uncharacterized protein n=1 Tax=Cesiribacter andamanensis AMV16 TaxID=1279009 RepID=M7NYY0_9BACT|nr:hypothetical protein [Cesiribacter andamanensis]EMR03579.1 hypothetical protein ADICEAN_01260 [Cesiribacter andamanensis AMV16]
MVVVNKSEMLLRSRTAVQLELIQKFIHFMQQELLPGCRVTGTIQTNFRNYSEMSAEEFLQVYGSERAVHWTIEFAKEGEWAAISFQHLQQSVDRGVAHNNFEPEKSQHFRQQVLRQLDVDLS